MAELAVKSATNWLGMLLVEEGKHLWGAGGQVEELRDELLWMQSFLRDADTIQHDDEIVRLWVFQIKEYVSKAEDIIDDFVIKISSRRKQTGWRKVKRFSCFLGELVAIHKAASDIDSLRVKISTLSPKLERYGLKTPAYGIRTCSRAREPLSEEAEQSFKHVHVDGNNNIVGLDDATAKVVAALKSSPPCYNCGVVAICGMGGLGKTTLAMSVFHDDEITKHFRGGRAWAYIGNRFQAQGVLRAILGELTSRTARDFSEKSERELARELHEYLLKNKCLVVLDDVRTKHMWDSLRRTAFAACGGESGSKVLLTTRKDEVANDVDPESVCKPDLLQDGKDWELLGKLITRRVELTTSTNNDVSEMIRLGKQMVKRCNGLPLAIVVLGGILRKKETLDEWRFVHKNISSYLRRGYDHGKTYMEVLLQSYNELPYHLKPCFLYLGNFPEDREICADKLYRMWMAEGLVMLPSDTVMGAQSLEDVCGDILDDLAQAGMIEVVKKESNGRIKSIRMHDLMRDVCLQKAAAENFLSIIDHRHCPDTPLSFSPYFSHKRLLRMAVYLAPGVTSFIPGYLSSKAHRYLRSLSFIAGHEVDDVGKYQEWMKSICSDFVWLRVLVLEGFYLQGKLTRSIRKLIHLRYLSLKDTKVSKLPSSLGNLRFLMILDLRVSSDVSSLIIPNVLWKLDKLRHLLLPVVQYEIKRAGMLRVDTLICLETLENLQLSNLETEDMLKLQNMRRLSIKDTVEAEDLLNSLILQSPALKSGSLQSCSFGIKGDLIDKTPSMLSSCDCIHSLKLVDPISVKAIDIAFPRSLKELHLESCKLEDDPMRILGSLYQLSDLFLDMDSFVGEELVCDTKSFPLLTTLILRGLPNLKGWTLRDESMSKLKFLTIKDCGKLREIPDALPSSVQVTCLPCVSGNEKYGACSFSVASRQKHLVKLYDYTKWLAEPLVEGDHDIFVLWGEGGIGKATNAKEIYHHPLVRDRFEAFAWACLPRKPTIPLPARILQGLVRDLDPEKSREELSQKSHQELVASLGKVMQSKRCLVVLINLDGFDAGTLDKTFGPGCFQRGSKLLITSNTLPPPTECNRLLVEQVRPLTTEESWELLYKMLKCQIDVLCSNPLEWKSIVTKHPLSITMLRGLLSMKETAGEWGDIRKKVTECGPVDLKRIFELCYDDLPPHLVPCFLYLTKFPEDMEVSTKKLYQLLIAAGFVGLKDEGDEFLENLAESYLVELVRRGMVRVGKRGYTGKIRTCQLQFGLWQLCLSKAEQRYHHPQSELSIHKHQGEDDASVASTSSNEHGSNFTLSSSASTGSVMYFGGASSPMDPNPNPNVDWEWFTDICKGFELLRVLDLEGMRTPQGILPEQVESLSQLRYLSLKRTWVTQLPPSIQKLASLETLDLRVFKSLIIPDVLCKLKSLRHLYLPVNLTVLPHSAKLQLRGLDNLQTLFNLQSDKVDLSHVHELKLVRRISIRKMHSAKEVDDMLKSTGTCVDLSVNSDVINSKPSILSSIQSLYKLKIKGRISVALTPQMFPTHLKELLLKHTRLEQDPLPVLEKLPELRRVFFDHESFLGEKITFSGESCKLKGLTLRSLNNLRHLESSERGMQCLESVLITECWRLDIGDVKTKFRKARITVE